MAKEIHLHFIWHENATNVQWWEFLFSSPMILERKWKQLRSIIVKQIRLWSTDQIFCHEHRLRIWKRRMMIWLWTKDHPFFDSFSSTWNGLTRNQGFIFGRFFWLLFCFIFGIQSAYLKVNSKYKWTVSQMSKNVENENMSLIDFDNRFNQIGFESVHLVLIDFVKLYHRWFVGEKDNFHHLSSIGMIMMTDRNEWNLNFPCCWFYFSVMCLSLITA